jgi:hypothetical protein
MPLLQSQSRPLSTASSARTQSKPYKNDPQIIAMTDLVSAYQANDIRRFERILKTNRKAIMDDPFVREYIQGEQGAGTRRWWHAATCNTA